MTWGEGAPPGRYMQGEYIAKVVAQRALGTAPQISEYLLPYIYVFCGQQVPKVSFE